MTQNAKNGEKKIYKKIEFIPSFEKMRKITKTKKADKEYDTSANFNRKKKRWPLQKFWMSASSAIYLQKGQITKRRLLRILRNISICTRWREQKVREKVRFLYKQLIPWAYLLDDRFVSIWEKVPLQQTQIHPDIRSSSGLWLQSLYDFFVSQ